MILVINLYHSGWCKDRSSGCKFAFYDVDGRDDVTMLRV